MNKLPFHPNTTKGRAATADTGHHAENGFCQGHPGGSKQNGKNHNTDYIEEKEPADRSQYRNSQRLALKLYRKQHFRMQHPLQFYYGHAYQNHKPRNFDAARRRTRTPSGKIQKHEGQFGYGRPLFVVGRSKAGGRRKRRYHKKTVTHGFNKCIIRPCIYRQGDET